MYLHFFGPGTVATEHPYLVGFGLLGIFEPKTVLVLATLVLGLISLVVSCVLCLIGFTTAGVRTGTFLYYHSTSPLTL